jgi:hypothetical protein
MKEIINILPIAFNKNINYFLSINKIKFHYFLIAFFFNLYQKYFFGFFLKRTMSDKYFFKAFMFF